MMIPYGARLLIAGGAFFLIGQSLAATSAEKLLATGARVVTNNKTGAVRFIGFDATSVTDQPNTARREHIPAETAAAQHLSEYAGLLGLRDVVSETKAIKHRLGDNGHAMTRYQQHYKGIPVIAGELIVNQDSKRNLTSISGKISPQLNLDTAPVITMTEASNIARQVMSRWYRLPETEFVVPAPVLSIFDSRLMSPHEDPVALVWRLDVTTKSLQPINEFIAIDAKTGAIALHFNQVPHAKDRITYDAANTTTLPGTLVCNESNPTCADGIADAVYAHRYAGTTYDYYQNQFGRDGIDGAGLTMISTVRGCKSDEPCPLANAFWNGSQMVYGEGTSIAEDVVAHEFTHGVTDYASKLFYYYQSGAINESLSDVFGEFIQQSNPTGTVTPATRWLLAEDLSTGPLRNMSNPPAFNNPDRMTSVHYSTDGSDNGGVHINSGVNNKAAVLMVDGGVFNGRTVTGIGLTKAAKIYYLVQTSLLTSGSDYLDLHNALYQACQNLIGTSGIVAADCQSVQNATLAVEMNLEPKPGFKPSAAMCPTGQSVSSTLLSDGLESGGMNFIPARTSGTTNWVLSKLNSKTGIWSLYGVSPPTISDLTMRMANAVTVPADAHLWFSHAFDFGLNGSTFNDGGVLEYAVNDGAGFRDAAGLYADGQNYAGVLAADNPLEGRNAFVGQSHGYVSSRFNLASLAGKPVFFRWRVATDSSGSARGWFVDDVKIHVCETVVGLPPGAPTLNSAVPGGGSVTLTFTAPANGGGSAITGYTATCTSSGQTTRMASGTGSPLTVFGLVGGVSYACSLTATNAEGLVSSASDTLAVTPTADKGIAPLLMYLLD